MAVKIRGPRSLAGFKPNPALIPKVVPMVKTISPMRNGAIFDPTPIFFASNNAKMVPTNKAVPKTSIKERKDMFTEADLKVRHTTA